MLENWLPNERERRDGDGSSRHRKCSVNCTWQEEEPPELADLEIEYQPDVAEALHQPRQQGAFFPDSSPPVAPARCSRPPHYLASRRPPRDATYATARRRMSRTRFRFSGVSRARYLSRARERFRSSHSRRSWCSRSTLVPQFRINTPRCTARCNPRYAEMISYAHTQNRASTRADSQALSGTPDSKVSACARCQLHRAMTACDALDISDADGGLQRCARREANAHAHFGVRITQTLYCTSSRRL